MATAYPIPPAPVAGPSVPWMFGAQPIASPSVVPPALLRNMTAAEQIAMSLNAQPATTPVGRAVLQAGRGTSAGAGSTASRVASPVVQAAAQAAGGNQALGAAGRTGLAARFAGSGAPTYLTRRLAGQSTAGLGMRSMAAGSLGRALGFAGAGYLGGQGVEAITGHQEGTWDDALRNATVGAGIGAGIGSVVPVIGTAIGAGLGGVGGGIHGLLTGRGSDEGEAAKAYEKEYDKFADALDAYNTSDDLRQEFLAQFAGTTAGLGRGEITEVATQMREMLPQLAMEDRAIRQEERGRAAMFGAAQAWMAPMMEDAMSRSTRYGDQLSQAIMGTADQLGDPTARAFAREDAARIPLDIATQQAYAMQQMMSLPGLYGYQTQPDRNGVPQMDFSSILGATPIGGQTGAPGTQSTGGLPPELLNQLMAPR